MSRSLGGQAVDHAASDPDLAAVRALEAGDQAEGGRLAAAGGPDQDQELPVGRLQGEILQHRDFAEALPDPRKLQCGHALARSFQPARAGSCEPRATSTCTRCVAPGETRRQQAIRQCCTIDLHSRLRRRAALDLDLRAARRDRGASCAPGPSRAAGRDRTAARPRSAARPAPIRPTTRGSQAAAPVYQVQPARPW